MKIVYLGVFLTDDAHNALLTWWQMQVGSVHSKMFAHHMTVQFRPTEEQIRDFIPKQECALQVIGYAHDDKAQAVLVKPSCAYGVKCQNAHPHITISTEYTSPVYANDLLAKPGAIQRVLHGPTLQAWTGYWDGKEIRYEVDDGS